MNLIQPILGLLLLLRAPFTLLTTKFLPSREAFLGSSLRFTQSSDSRKFALFASFAAYLHSSALSASSAVKAFGVAPPRCG
ncbi:MAG: hypothetical protein DMG65_04510 [Candidatus Angelobacter sp. Gp1-AA117]|nr:MAG: hypothetical protein DMG65_04510 [Candidatus Angelobacter sp. Gp1-AA117]